MYTDLFFESSKDQLMMKDSLWSVATCLKKSESSKDQVLWRLIFMLEWLKNLNLLKN